MICVRQQLLAECGSHLTFGGVHFLRDARGDDVGRKLLRVNLSDLAAKGAEPLAYVLTVALPPDLADAWLDDFSAGLRADQEEFGVHLIGGDTTRSEWDLVLSVTVLPGPNTAGGFGVAFLCKHQVAGTDVVIKTLLSDHLDRGVDQVFAEAHVLRELDHPAIVRFLDSGHDQDRFWFAMEYVAGPSYEELRDQQGRLPWQDVLELAWQIAPAVTSTPSRARSRAHLANDKPSP